MNFALLAIFLFLRLAHVAGNDFCFSRLCLCNDREFFALVGFWNFFFPLRLTFFFYLLLYYLKRLLFYIFVVNVIVVMVTSKVFIR